MEKKDYMPSKDEEFDVLQDNVYTAATGNAVKWLIPTSLISTLDAPRLRWKNAFTAYKNPAIRTPAVTREKNDAKKVYTSLMRPFIQGQLMHNTIVTDADRLDMGLPVHDRTPTIPSPPASRTEIQIDFSQIAQHTLHVRDSETKSASKPSHVIGYELWRRIGGDNEPTYDDMQLVEIVTRSSHLLQYTSFERSKTVWYATRWVNTRGKGPWSEIVSAIVP
jgi:hypothetical protein